MDGTSKPIAWKTVHEQLDAHGSALLPGLLSRRQCDEIRRLYPQDGGFRSRIVMEKHNFGRGEYKYFSYPLPELVASLRQNLYPELAVAANRWNEQLGIEDRFPAKHAEFVAQCHAAGQKRPTPLVLRYGAEDYNCLHQDLYGSIYFPLQVAILLSEPGRDFEGGEFVLVEQRPRMQSRVEVIPLKQGDAVVFAVNQKPRLGKRGYFRTTMRHGVSTIRSGERLTLGIIFHDAT
jgi:hypothetical protein